MFKQHCRFSILLLVLILIHSVCPLLCAAVGEKFCSFSPETAMIEHTDDGSSCCHRHKTDETEIPYDDSEACCYNDVTFVISNESGTDDGLNKLERQHFTSILPSTPILLTKQDMFLHHTYPFKPPISSFHYAISLRGPPGTLS